MFTFGNSGKSVCLKCSINEYVNHQAKYDNQISSIFNHLYEIFNVNLCILLTIFHFEHLLLDCNFYLNVSSTRKIEEGIDVELVHSFVGIFQFFMA